jgi:chromosome partitioning protein
MVLILYCHMCINEQSQMESNPVKVLVFAATKGGTGKSTLAYNVGVFASRTHQVLFADLDPQGSLTELWARRGELINPRLVKNVQSVASAVTRLHEGGYAHDYLLVDTPGSHIPAIRDAIAAADVVLLPVQASALDVMGQDAAFDIVESTGMHDRALILLNRIDGRSKAFADKIGRLLTVQTRLPIVRIAQRMAYAKAGTEAKTGAEIDKDCAAEIGNVWDAIRGVMIDDRR